MSTKCIELDEIGIVKLCKSKLSKNIKITVKALEPIRVSMPHWVSYDEALNFVCERTSWIKENKNKIENENNKLTIFDKETEFKTKEHELELIESYSNQTNYRLSNGKIKVYYPQSRDPKEKKIQETIREAIELALRKEAKAFLPQRTSELAYKHQLYFNRAFVKNTKSQWGSCSSENNINLSIHLMRLPDHLIDYVILHELAHTLEKNHSHRFWSLLDSMTEISAKALDHELKAYQIKTY